MGFLDGDGVRVEYLFCLRLWRIVRMRSWERGLFVDGVI